MLSEEEVGFIGGAVLSEEEVGFIGLLVGRGGI